MNSIEKRRIRIHPDGVILVDEKITRRQSFLLLTLFLRKDYRFWKIRIRKINYVMWKVLITKAPRNIR